MGVCRQTLQGDRSSGGVADEALELIAAMTIFSHVDQSLVTP
jgi:hypothetical protein